MKKQIPLLHPENELFCFDTCAIVLLVHPLLLLVLTTTEITTLLNHTKLMDNTKHFLNISIK